MDNMELVIKTNLEKIPKAIEFNFDQIKAAAAEALSKYQGRVVTEDGIKDAKKDKAALNAFKSALDDERKRIKKLCLSPYEAFEKQIKELVGMMDTPLLAIDSQIKAFDEQKKADKQAEILAFYQSKIGVLDTLLPFEKFFNPRWLNVSYKMADIEKELSDAIFKADNDIRIINKMGLECSQQMLDVYIRTLDMSAAMAEKTRWEEQQAKLKELESAQRKEEPKTVVIDGMPGHDLSDAKPGDHIVFSGYDESAPMPFDEPEQLKTIKVIFYDTSEAFRHEMKALTDKYGIRYGGIR